MVPVWYIRSSSPSNVVQQRERSPWTQLSSNTRRALLLSSSSCHSSICFLPKQACKVVREGYVSLLDVLYRNSKPRKSRTPVTLFLLCCVSSSPDRPISFLSAFLFFFFFSLPFFCWRGRSCKKLNNKSYRHS